MSGNRFDDMFDKANESFDDKYDTALEQLKGLTAEQIQSVSPTTNNQAAFNKLVQAVQTAKSQNLSQADLITNIKSLGDTAIKLAKKIPQFAALL